MATSVSPGGAHCPGPAENPERVVPAPGDTTRLARLGGPVPELSRSRDARRRLQGCSAYRMMGVTTCDVNRLLPAGPTVADTIANGAFYYGLVRALADEERPIWTQMEFDAAERNLYTAARYGIQSPLVWPDSTEFTAAELVLRR